MTKARPWPNNAKEARDRCAEDAVRCIRLLRPVVAGDRFTEAERLRRTALALSLSHDIARRLQGVGAPIVLVE